MAVITTMFCKICKEVKQTTVGSGQSIPMICCSCAEKEADEKRRLHFSGLDGLTIEERLRKVEEWIYNYKRPIDPRNIRF
jgi:hypothetical protein